MKRWITGLVILVIVVGAAAWGWRYTHSAGAAEDRAVPTAVAKLGDIRSTVESTGTVVSNLDVEIKCKASGEITKLPYDISDQVKKGDLLVQLDPIDEQRNVRRAQAALDSSQAKLATAKENLLIAQQNLATNTLTANANLRSAQATAKDAAAKADRMKQLLDKKLASEEDYETAQTAAVKAQAALHTAQAQVEQLKADKMTLVLRQQDIKLAEAALATDRINFENAQQQLKDTTVLAPMNGVVSARDVQTGQIISSGITNVGGGTTIMTLSDLSRIFVEASVDESDIGKVIVGQNVDITADAFPGVRFQGKVMRIATQGVNTSNVVTFNVKVEVLGDNRSLLKPQMTANVSILVNAKDDVLAVPVEAIFRHAGKELVTVVEPDGKTHDQAVRTGLNDGRQWEIISGLKAGQRVQVQSNNLATSRWRAGGGAHRVIH